jgi:flagellar biosynthesis protein FlhF
MLLKTYRAPDLAAALAAARREMGPDALVLGTSEHRGGLGLEAVEVTVAAPRAGSPAGAEASASASPSPPSASSVAPPAAPAPGRSSDAPEGIPAPLRAAASALVAAGVSEDLARRFARIAAHETGARPGAHAVAVAVERSMARLLEFATPPFGARCLMVVGPPGCGKTTTVAKIAARVALAGERRVFLAAADGDRVGALEQAEIYARHCGAVLARVDSADDLARAVADAGERGTVIVDTPGIGAADRDRFAGLAALRASVPGAAVAVLLPAGLHHLEAARVLERFAPLRPACAAFSRVDDAGRVGELVTALAAARLPLAFVTDGHRIPDDLARASARGLTALLLRSGRDAIAAAETPR